MARYTFGAIETHTVVDADFGKFIEAVKGRSITSLADWGSDRLELGLSGNVMLRVFATGTEIEFNCISTQNLGDPPAFASQQAGGAGACDRTVGHGRRAAALAPHR